MTFTTETSLPYFEFWSGAKDRAELLTFDELDQLDSLMEDLFCDHTPTETEINDLFWFEFETVCELLGYRYEDGKVIRDNNEDEDDEEQEEEEQEQEQKRTYYLLPLDCYNQPAGWVQDIELTPTEFAEYKKNHPNAYIFEDYGTAIRRAQA